MKLEIINETQGNPFIFYQGVVSPFLSGRKLSERKIKRIKGRDYYLSQSALERALRGMMTFVSPVPRKTILEVGAGNTDDKLRFFLKNNYNVCALDQDFTKLISRIQNQRDSPIKGWESHLIPYLVGENLGVKHYHGDVGLINDPLSELQGAKFGLILFYGSLITQGNSRTIDQSRVSREIFENLLGTNIDEKKLEEKSLKTLRDRIQAVRGALLPEGSLIAVSSDFTGYLYQDPELLVHSRLSHLNLLFNHFMDAEEVKLFGLSKPYITSCLVSQGYKPEIVEESFSMNLLDSFESLRPDKDYLKQKSELSDNSREAINSLGTIDAIVARYN